MRMMKSRCTQRSLSRGSSIWLIDAVEEAECISISVQAAIENTWEPMDNLIFIPNIDWTEIDANVKPKSFICLSKSLDVCKVAACKHYKLVSLEFHHRSS